MKIRRNDSVKLKKVSSPRAPGGLSNISSSIIV